MICYIGDSDLGNLINNNSLVDNEVFKSIKSYVKFNRHSLASIENKNTPVFIELNDLMFFKYAHSLTVLEDTVSFGAVFVCMYKYFVNHGGKHTCHDDVKWFCIHCKMRISNKIEAFNVSRIEVYTPSQKKPNSNAVSQNFVPIISKENLDIEAEIFLQKWCPQALVAPMPVPIVKIVKEKMGLNIIKDKSLSKDLSVFGQICFADGIVKIYDKTSEEYIDTQVQRGTIMIDPNTVMSKSLGCIFNTIAHEAYHWDRHRIYGFVQSILSTQQTVCHRCSISPQKNSAKRKSYSDEDRIEWQANKIAPKILMPQKQTKMKIESLIKEHHYIPYADGSDKIIRYIICELSNFYNVSKQAAKIRMIELGYPEANDVFNYDNESESIFHKITQTEAF